MFSKTIIDSDAFLDMPLSTQALYFHLAMRADDEGFVNNPKKVQRMIGASEDDLKILIMKRYILTFESGIIVIKHWKIHNYIQNDRFKPTTYVEEKATLTLDEKKSYTECIQNVSKVEPQVSIGKVSIDKNNILCEQVAEKKKKFEKPTLEEVSAYCKERNNGIDAEAFIAFYESKGWLIGKTPMKSWKSAIITWEKSRKQNQPQAQQNYATHSYTKEEMNVFDNIDNIEL